MSGMYDEVEVSDAKMTPFPDEPRNNKYGRVADPVAYILGAEQRARERQVAIETVRIVRRDLIHCYRREGVNHFENCRKEAKKYWDVIHMENPGMFVTPPSATTDS